MRSELVTLQALTRSTSWGLVGETPLAFDSGHPQGIVRIGTTWWISSVDVATRTGSLVAFGEDGGLLERVKVGDDRHFHPGGIDFDGHAIWVPAAEYVPHSSTTIYRFEPGEAPTQEFRVEDHIGAIGRCGEDGDLVGWSWGSRSFFRWSSEGVLLERAENPSHFVDLQDLQWLGDGYFLCGGVAGLRTSTGKEWVGGLAVLRSADLSLVKSVPFQHYSPLSNRVATQNPLWCESVNGDLLVHVLPDDGHSVLLTYATPLHA